MRINPVFFSLSDRALFSSPKTPNVTFATPANQLLPATGQAVGTLKGAAPHSSQVKESGRRRGHRKGGARKAGPDEMDGSELENDIHFAFCCAAGPASDPPVPLEAEPRIDVSRLDLRVGRILRVRRHPMSTMQSMQEVDVGESATRTVVSRLAETTNFEEVFASKFIFATHFTLKNVAGVSD